MSLELLPTEKKAQLAVLELLSEPLLRYARSLKE